MDFSGSALLFDVGIHSMNTNNLHWSIFPHKIVNFTFKWFFMILSSIFSKHINVFSLLESRVSGLMLLGRTQGCPVNIMLLLHVQLILSCVLNMLLAKHVDMFLLLRVRIYSFVQIPLTVSGRARSKMSLDLWNAGFIGNSSISQE